MKDYYIIHAKRTAIGKLSGKLAPLRVDDMMAELLKDFSTSFDFDMSEIDDVVVGCANQAGEDNRNLARMAVILSGLPHSIPGVTLNRLCGSSLDAVIDACGRISLGLAECVLVGGAESMSRAPLVISKSSGPFGRDQKMYDTTFGWRFPNPKMQAMFPLLGMGETAEKLVEQFKISREDQDKFALASHMKAIKAQDRGAFDDEILPIKIKLRKSEYVVSKDEGPRKETSLEKLASLKAVFKKDGSVTAGNSSMMNDGASLVAVVSEDFLKRHKLTPIAKVSGFGVKGREPNTMGLGPVDATKVLMNKFNKKINDFDVIELNEAFSAQALSCIESLKLDPSKINLNGGAISLGHPLGCSGARILTTLTHIMNKDPNLKQGLATMCIGVGQGVALSIENCK